METTRNERATAMPVSACGRPQIRPRSTRWAIGAPIPLRGPARGPDAGSTAVPNRSVSLRHVSPGNCGRPTPALVRAVDGATPPATAERGGECLRCNDNALSTPVKKVAHDLDDRAAVFTEKSGLQRPAATPPPAARLTDPAWRVAGCGGTSTDAPPPPQSVTVPYDPGARSALTGLRVLLGAGRHRFSPAVVVNRGSRMRGLFPGVQRGRGGESG